MQPICRLIPHLPHQIRMERKIPIRRPQDEADAGIVAGWIILLINLLRTHIGVGEDGARGLGNVGLRDLLV